MLLSSQIDAGGYSITKEEITLTEPVNQCLHDCTSAFPKRHIDKLIDEESLNGDDCCKWE
jgi:hypothetical protein